MSRPECEYLGCRSYGIWQDVDTGKVYCGAHSCVVIDEGEDPSIEKRRDFADEYKRDADREARSL